MIAGVGNAYSDEALHAAKLSPFKPAGQARRPRRWRALQAAWSACCATPSQRSVGLPAGGLKAEKRSGLAVHGRTGEPCPVCGDTIREVSFATKSFSTARRARRAAVPWPTGGCRGC